MDTKKLEIFLILIFLLGTVIIYLQIKGCESCDMYAYHLNFSKGELTKKGVMGYYDYGNYYCVWTKERSPSSIERTDYHETCHDLVFNNYEHFCENVKRKNE